MALFPSTFDPELYLSKHQDLRNAGFDVTNVYNHYIAHGRHEGRICSQVHNTSSFLATIPSFSSMLELMPGIFPVVKGKNVQYADTMTHEDLVQLAQNWNLEKAYIPSIDYHIPCGNWSDINNTFDAVITNHNFNRHPNLAQLLNQLAKLIKPDGAVYCIVTDKRYASDHFWPAPNIDTVLSRMNNNDNTFTQADIYNSITNRTHANAALHWQGNHGKVSTHISAATQHTLSLHSKEINQAQLRHLQAYAFCPDSFAHTVNTLFLAGHTTLQITRLYPTTHNNNEFYAILQPPQ